MYSYPAHNNPNKKTKKNLETKNRTEDQQVTLKRTLLAVVCAATAAVSFAAAQDADTEKAIEKYRQMLRADPWSNPGFLDVDRGEALWKTARGPNKVSLEKCDLGKGPGKVEGAFAELPRFFADAGKVMDLESRLLWCQEKLQGFSHADLIKRPHPGGGAPVKDTGALATYVASKSSGMKYAAKFAHPKEKEVLALGETLFNRRSGPFDFACTTCHAESGKRIRLQGLAHLADPKAAAKVVGEWPAYRVSNAHVMTMQHRLVDCYWQMRLPEPELRSDVTRPMISYPPNQAKGRGISVPGLKR